MKNQKSRQMFLDEINLAILIITRAIHQRMMSSFAAALLVGLSALLVVPVAAQTSNIDALNIREHIAKGNALLTHRDYEGAIAEYEEALMKDPSNTTAKDNIVLTHNNWGIDFYKHNKYEDAREHWNTALKLNPNDRNAKNNLSVLRAQLKKLGLSPDGAPKSETAKSGSDEEPKSGGAILPKGAQTAREDNTPVPNAVIIGRPSSLGGQSSSAAASENSNASLTTGGGNGSGGVGSVGVAGSSSASGVGSGASAAVIMPKSTSSASGFDTPRPSAPTFPASATAPSAAVTTTTPPAQFSSSSTTASSLGTSNIEDKLAALENKVYGRTSKDIPILQRLERLERDTSSRPSLGSINDRVQTLIKTYGL
jgi:tetratricopeptide (TPR) repeat protein